MRADLDLYEVMDRAISLSLRAKKVAVRLHVLVLQPGQRPPPVDPSLYCIDVAFSEGFISPTTSHEDVLNAVASPLARMFDAMLETAPASLATVLLIEHVGTRSQLLTSRQSPGADSPFFRFHAKVGWAVRTGLAPEAEERWHRSHAPGTSNLDLTLIAIKALGDADLDAAAIAAIGPAAYDKHARAMTAAGAALDDLKRALEGTH